jgi:primosomal protein N' (replication factor Y) (superfamily II helicase)
MTPSKAEPRDPVIEGRARYVRVAVNAGRPTFLTFSYAIPADREIAPGEVVHAPFGRQTLQGIVIDGPIDTPGYDPSEVRPLEPAIEDAPRVTPDRMQLAAWLRDYYLAPPWEAHALFLPPGAGERPETLLVRVADPGDADPAALSERQLILYNALTDEPQEQAALKRSVQSELPARGFDAALRVLIRRGLAGRRYHLQRPRGRARVAEVVRLAVPPEEALAAADAIEGRRSSRRGRAIRALVSAGGPLSFDFLAKEARGAPAVQTLIDQGILTRAIEGDRDHPKDGVHLAIEGEDLARLLRQLSRGQADQAAVAVIERLAALAPNDTVEDNPTLDLRALSRDLGSQTREGVRRLISRELVTVEEVLDRRDPLRDLQVVRRPPVEPIGAQRQAAVAIRSAVDREDGTGFVLHGVTGSGKTEVYLDALRHTVEQGKRGIVLVPEIALTPQTVRRFAERFPGRVGVLHSGLTLGEAFDQWHEIASGAYDVVIGSRSAVFAPQPDLGLIVIDEAHEWTYKQSDPAPRYDARTVALELGRRSGAAVVLGSATPDAERWVAAESGQLTRLDLPNRIRPVVQPDGDTRLWPVDELPEVELVDIRGARQLFSDTLVEALGQTLDREEQAILFLNRRGFSAFMLCNRGHSPACSSCDVALSLHREPDGRERLIFHQCGRGRPLPQRCDESGCGQALRPVSAGTQQVEAEVRRHFPAARVVRWDRDTTRSADDHEAKLRQFTNHEADVLVGTQMVAKGLDLPDVTLVGVVLADYSLREGDFRAGERTFQLLVQVAGRAGRAERDGRVIIQTLQPDHPAIIAAAAQDPDRFFEDELRWRAEHGYPPYTRLVRLQFSHPSLPYVAEEAHRLAGEIRDRAPSYPNIVVTGPTPPAVARLRGRHRLQILVFGDNPAALIGDLQEALPVGWSVDVDPLLVG